LSTTISERNDQKAISIVGFVGIMVYAWLTMANTGKSGPDLFPGIFHPVEFALVIVVAFSVLIIAYASACSILLKDGFTRGSTVRFIALAGVTALLWTFQAYVGEFVVSEGNTSSLGYQVLYVTFLQPHNVVKVFRDVYYWEWLPEFVATFAILILFGSIFALLRRGPAFETRRVFMTAITYIAFLIGGLELSRSADDISTLILASVLVGVGVWALALVIENRLARAVVARGTSLRADNVCKNSLLWGLCGAIGIFAGGVLMQEALSWWASTPGNALHIVLVISIAAITSLATALTVQALIKYEEPDAIEGVLPPPLPTRPVRARS
jgi:hypothetical protein